MRLGSRRLSAGRGSRRVTVAKFPVCSATRGPPLRVESREVQRGASGQPSRGHARSRGPLVALRALLGIQARAHAVGEAEPQARVHVGAAAGAGRGVASQPPRRDLHVCGGPRLPAPSQLQVRAGRAGLEDCGRAETRAPPHPDPGRTAPPRAPGARAAASLSWLPRSSRSPGCEVAQRPSPPSALQSSAPSLAARSWAILPPRAPEGQSHERNVQLSSHRGHSVPIRRGLSQWLHQHFGVSEPRAKGGGRRGRRTSCVSLDAQSPAPRWRAWAP